MKTGKVLMVLLGLLFLVGVYSIGSLIIQGHGPLGSTDVVPWNIFVSLYAYLAGAATGLCMIASLGPVFGIQRYWPLAKTGYWLAVFVLLGAFIAIIADLGSPLKAYYFLLSPNLTSPIFWMFFLYQLLFFSMLLELYSLMVKKIALARIAGILCLVFAFAASGNLGLVFGSVYSRDLWYGPFTPFSFVMVAWILATSMLMIATKSMKELESNQEVLKAIYELRFILLGLLLLRFVYSILKVLLGVYLGRGDILLLISGPLRHSFWVGEVLIGIFLPALLVTFNRFQNQITRMDILASILVLLGFFVARYNLVIGGQLSPVLPGIERGSYTVTIFEWQVVVGILAFIGLGFMISRGIGWMTKESLDSLSKTA